MTYVCIVSAIHYELFLVWEFTLGHFTFGHFPRCPIFFLKLKLHFSSSTVASAITTWSSTRAAWITLSRIGYFGISHLIILVNCHWGSRGRVAGPYFSRSRVICPLILKWRKFGHYFVAPRGTTIIIITIWIRLKESHWNSLRWEIVTQKEQVSTNTGPRSAAGFLK